MLKARILAQIVINKNQGISLIELMLAIFIFSMISMFTIPTYQNYILRANRMEAKLALYDLANHLENHFHTYNTYVNATLGTHETTDVLSSTVSENNHYNLSIISASKNSYAIQASLINQKIDKDCSSFILTSTGIKDATGSDKESCW